MSIAGKMSLSLHLLALCLLNERVIFSVESKLLRGLTSSAPCLTKAQCRKKFREMETGGTFNQGDWETKGCFKKNGNGFWGIGGDEEMMSESELPGKQERIWCDATATTTEDAVSTLGPTPNEETPEEAAANKPCLTVAQCREKSRVMNPGIGVHVSDWKTKGCFTKKGKAYFGTGGTVEEMSVAELPGLLVERVWCDKEEAVVLSPPTTLPPTPPLTCLALDATCDINQPDGCCTGFCRVRGSVCTCMGNGRDCDSDAYCCSGICQEGTNGSQCTCAANGETCHPQRPKGCCSGFCSESTKLCAPTPEVEESTPGPSPAPTPVLEPVTDSPTKQPTTRPVTGSPTKEPSAKPVTDSPTREPTPDPTSGPIEEPSAEPRAKTTDNPTGKPIEEGAGWDWDWDPVGGDIGLAPPTIDPTYKPTAKPSSEPTPWPTYKPAADLTEGESATELCGTKVCDEGKSCFYAGWPIFRYYCV